MAWKSTKRIGTGKNAMRIAIADLVTDVDPTAMLPGDKLIDEQGRVYEIALRSGVQTWLQSGGGGTLVSSSVDGPTLTAAATAECIPPGSKITLPANYCGYLGLQLLLEMTGRISSANPSPGTARFQLMFDGTAVFDTLAILLDPVAARTNVGWVLRVLLTLRAVGASAAFLGQGTFTCEDLTGTPATPPKGSLSAVLPWNAAPADGTTFDSRVAHVVDVNFIQTVGTGSMTVHQYGLRKVA